VSTDHPALEVNLSARSLSAMNFVKRATEPESTIGAWRSQNSGH
jgi:hypothetical protein